MKDDLAEDRLVVRDDLSEEATLEQNYMDNDKPHEEGLRRGSPSQGNSECKSLERKEH